MGSISKQIGFDYDKSKSLDKSIIIGDKYRFTILSESLIRLEYSETNTFEDRPSLFAQNRMFEPIEFNFNEDPLKLKIETKFFRLTYRKGKPFKGGKLIPDMNLKVELLGTTKIWYYNHQEFRNFGAPGKSLVDENGKVKFNKGLFSPDGFVCLDDSKTHVVLENGNMESRNENNIDLYLFMYGNDFGKCLRDYYTLTGYPPLIPRYALGNWWSRDIDYSQEDINDLVTEFNDKEIPFSVILLNHKWHIDTYENKNNIQSGFTFNSDRFHNYQECINNLHNNNIKLGLSINPINGIYPYEKNYESYKNYMNCSDEIIPFNVFNGNTYIAYFNFLIKPLLDDGIDALWINSNDIEKNAQLVLNTYHSANVMNLHKRIMLLTNNAFIAPHRYPILYSGHSIVNWNTLKKIPFHNLSAANIGVSWWSHDIGGFYKGIEDEELYTRFVQLGVFSPIFKFGSASGKYYKRKPWLWEVKTYEIVKDYLSLRHRLIPYLYTEMYKYHKSGIPFIKPLYYKTPKMYDDNIYRNEYYFGSEMFIAPIVDKRDKDMNRVIHRFFLPEGVWYEFFSGKKFIGGKNYLYFVKDEDYPVFVKAGGIIPLSNNLGNDTNPPLNMEIQIFPGQSNIYNLYEDDGISYLCNKGYYMVTNIEYECVDNNYKVVIKPLNGKKGVVPDFRNYKICFRNTKTPDNINVQVNGENIYFNHYMDENNFVIKLNNVSTFGNVVINISGNDMMVGNNRIMNDEIASILNDLQIETELKEKIDQIIFSELPINKKRINIRKLQKKGLEIRFMNLFLKLLEYIE